MPGVGFGSFKLFLVCFTSLLLIPTFWSWLWVAPYFIKNVKAHKARQKLETPEVKTRKKHVKNWRHVRDVKKMKARDARKRMRTRNAYKKEKAGRNVKIWRHVIHVKTRAHKAHEKMKVRKNQSHLGKQVRKTREQVKPTET